MRRPLLIVSLGAAMLLLSACAAAPILAMQAGSLLAVGAVSKSANDRKIDRCYEFEKALEAKKLGPAEAKRDRAKAGC